MPEFFFPEYLMSSWIPRNGKKHHRERERERENAQANEVFATEIKEHSFSISLALSLNKVPLSFMSTSLSSRLSNTPITLYDRSKRRNTSSLSSSHIHVSRSNAGLLERPKNKCFMNIQYETTRSKLTNLEMFLRLSNYSPFFKVEQNVYIYNDPVLNMKQLAQCDAKIPSVHENAICYCFMLFL